MSDDKEPLRIHPNASEAADKFTSIYVRRTPMRGKAGKFKESSMGYKTCGVCGKKNTKHVHYTSGATSDGTVEVQELQCLDCGSFTMYYYSDRT